jgi:hypothetical protein
VAKGERHMMMKDILVHKVDHKTSNTRKVVAIKSNNKRELPTGPKKEQINKGTKHRRLPKDLKAFLMEREQCF